MTMPSCYTIFTLLFLMALNGNAQTIRYEPEVIDFGTVAPCKHALDSFELVNESTDSVPTPSVFSINGFQVSFADTTRNIRVGERRRAYVRFTGDASVPLRNQVLSIQFARADGSFVPTRSIRFVGARTPGPCIRLALPVVTAQPGTIVDIGIEQEGDFIDFVNVIPELSFEVSWDASLMVPDAFPVPPLATGPHRATFRVPLAREGGRLLSLPFVVTLGNRTEAPIRLEWFSLSDAAVTAEGRGGRIVVDGLCVDPRTRLFDGSTSPMRAFIVHDITGRVLETLYATSLSDAASRMQPHASHELRFCVDQQTGNALPVWPR